MNSSLKLCFSLVLFQSVAIAASPATLLTFDEVQQRITKHDPLVRILDTRTRAEFDKGHMPGAVWVDVKAATTLAAKLNGLNDTAAWSAWIAPLGISEKTEVVIYGSGQQLEPARVWWLLQYLGVNKPGLIDGNFALWESQNRPVSHEKTSIESIPFQVKIQRDRLANREDVLAALEAKSAQVIDARSTAEYTGIDAKSKRSGHIPNACHLEWTQFVGKDGRFLGLTELNLKIAKAGLKPGDAVITHCQGGGRASVDAFIFERLGHPARNYYLGWSDWGNVEDTPISKEKQPTTKK